MKRLLLFGIATSFLNEILCVVGKTPLTLEKDILCQSKELNYWNAIVFKDFKANVERGLAASGIDGPLMVGSDLAIENYYVNSKGKMNCTSLYNETVPLTEYGLYMSRMDHTKQNYQIRDSIISGSIQVYGYGKNILDSLVRPVQSCRLLVNNPSQHNTLSMSDYENTAKKTSLYLALQKATHHLSKDGNIKSLRPHKNDKYYYFNFASCQNSAECSISSEMQHLSHPGAFAQDQHAVQWPVDKPVILNIPVVRNSTFELAGFQGFTSKLPACNTVWNFFTVDEDGFIDESSEQSFTVTRNINSLIGGTFLMPYGNVIDGSAGGFAGQLIAANYKTNGASLYDFEAVEPSCHAASALCWPYLRRNDVGDTEESKEEDDDYLEWTIRKGRQLFPLSNEGNGVFVDESNSGASFAATVAESLISEESILGEQNSASQAIHPQNFFADSLALGLAPPTQDELAVNPANPANPAKIEAFLRARPAPPPEIPMGELLNDLNKMRGRPKTTLTTYVGTATRTHHAKEVITTTIPLTKVKTVHSTTTFIEYTDTIVLTISLPYAVEAQPTGVSFDLMGDEIVTLY
ncbi:hypothetical protein BD408DRAFT_442966 [Parasitella parasitica]|nr:hypothetical protein BD408DRAFT_442966 [Parasitella parasitica]